LRPLGSVVVLMPPLSITFDQIDRLVDATAAAIAEATSESLPTRPAPLSIPPQASAAPAPLRGIFLIGTDTGVGKTTVGVALLTLARARGLAPSSLRRSLQRSSARNHLPLRILPSGCACSGSGTSLHPPHSGGHPLRSTSRCRSRRLPPGRVSRRRPLPLLR
jgi:hypothetical protein